MEEKSTEITSKNKRNNLVDYVLTNTKPYFANKNGRVLPDKDEIGMIETLEELDPLYTYRHPDNGWKYNCNSTLVDNSELSSHLPEMGDELICNQEVKRQADEFATFINTELVEFQCAYKEKLVNLKKAVQVAIKERNERHPKLFESLSKLKEIKRYEGNTDRETAKEKKRKRELEGEIATSLGLNYEELERKVEENELEKKKNKEKNKKKNKKKNK